jgi:hypothetical protein
LDLQQAGIAAERDCCLQVDLDNEHEDLKKLETLDIVENIR